MFYYVLVFLVLYFIASRIDKEEATAFDLEEDQSDLSTPDLSDYSL